MELFSTSIDKLKQIKDEYNNTVKEFAKTVANDLQNFVKQNKLVIGITWTQYTPYFNDGDPCVFRIREPRLKFIDTPDNAGDDSDGYITDYDIEGGEWKKSVRKI